MRLPLSKQPAVRHLDPRLSAALAGAGVLATSAVLQAHHMRRISRDPEREALASTRAPRRMGALTPCRT
jgi:hypothetical protein